MRPSINRRGLGIRTAGKEKLMIEFAIFHNGACDLPLARSPEGYVYNKGSLAQRHASGQRGVAAQVREAVLADALGFDYWFQTEHHFQIDGNERNSATLN